MKCISCGKELLDNSLYCNFCGYKQPVTINTTEDDQLPSDNDTQPANDTAKPKKHGTLKTIVLSIVLMVSLLALSIIILELKTNWTFRNALIEMKNGNYLGAMQQMNSIAGRKRDDFQSAVHQHLINLCVNNDYNNSYRCIDQLRRSKLLSNDVIDLYENEIRYSEAECNLSMQNYIISYSCFDELGNYGDSQSRAQEILATYIDTFYEYAISLFEQQQPLSTKWYSAKKWFTQLGDYMDSAEYLRKMEFLESIVGTYEYSDTMHEYRCIFDSCHRTLYSKYASGTYEVVVKPYELEILPYNEGYCLYGGNDSEGIAYCLDNNNVLMLSAHVENGIVVIDKGVGKTRERMRKITASTESLRSPALGMTEIEVRLSTWGNPKKVNKNTYSWGTSEQFVYEGYRYIYLDNGIVTSIQE